MFDFHMHSRVSFDSEGDARRMAETARARGLREICFTDHYDYHDIREETPDLFTLARYAEAYDGLAVEGLTVRRGVEYGLTLWNAPELKELLAARRFDFVIGSVHFVDGFDPYYPNFWQGKTVEQAFERYLEHTLDCVRIHADYDVLGHLNYVCKSEHNPSHAPLRYADHREICDEILRELVRRGKGMEINTSGVDRAGAFLPDAAFLRRFRELGGEIVTVGSDAHDEARVGQYVSQALDILREIFGYVCTFEDRRPIFHRL
ncbi:MAG: histidinol-phosphatase HisJ family protein [Ruminococcaceae bacterium]|nr:histidinol-phosphatase HisJ family protein [Oscillospiraceae bacterium]